MVFVVEAIISALLSASLQVLFDRTSPRTNLIEFFQRHKFDEILFKNLETTLLQVNAVLGDAEEKQITNLCVRQWIDELKDAAYHTVDLLDEIHSLALAESQASNSSALEKMVQKHKSKLEKMTNKLDNIAKHKDVLGLEASFSGKISPRLQLTSLVDETEVLESIRIEFYGNAVIPFASLRILKFEEMPKWINWSALAITGGGFHSLQELHLQKCQSLVEIPNCLPSLKLLIINECYQLQLDDIMDYPQLQDMSIKSCDCLKKFTLNFSSHLKSLKIHDCGNLRLLKISDNLHQDLNFFQELEIRKCPYLEIFSGRGLPAPNLTSFSVWNCNNLRSMPKQMCTLLTSLQTLNISGCPRLLSFPSGGLPLSLETLFIKNCVNLTPQNAWGLRNMTSLTFLTIESAYANVTSFPDDGLLPASLTFLQISEFPVLETLNLSGLHHLTLLKDLQIHSCNQLQILSDGSLPTSISSLTITGFPSLTNLCQKDQGIYWEKISHIPIKFINGNQIR
ncbi:hypothetical protein LWI28_003988 [Acer negundo]|uniref:Disease resistance N-terminal domain-containing protein n=1 Tax=Acer negundo TaxID=4023 RepID=A0AAD5ILA3_ACENE|nr:hypothetical protein LWI28_003988 [Acer negundo]